MNLSNLTGIDLKSSILSYRIYHFLQAFVQFPHGLTSLPDFNASEIHERTLYQTLTVIFLNFLCNFNVIIQRKEETLNTRKKLLNQTAPAKSDLLFGNQFFWVM